MGEQIYRLSSIDQSLVRSYIRYALFFPCNDADIDRIAIKLADVVRSTVLQLPMLAGNVRPITAGDRDGWLEVAVCPDDTKNFQPVVRHLRSKGYIKTYEEMSLERMPPMELIQEDLTPLPDTASDKKRPVFAVQASFIRGGVVVALYLHHSVSDIHGLAYIMRLMSNDSLPPLSINVSGKSSEKAQKQSRLRDRLSGSRGVQPDIEAHPEYNSRFTQEVPRLSQLQASRGHCCIFGFDLFRIDDTKKLLNKQFRSDRRTPFVPVSGFCCLAAILWKVVMRACWSHGSDGIDLESTLIVPVEIRDRLDQPLGEDYFGNATVHANAKAAVTRLCMPFELTHIAYAAHLIRAGVAEVDEHKVRSAIALINERQDAMENNIPSRCFDMCLVITSWADLPLEQAHLGLELGRPQWGRKIGRSHSAFGCIVLPVQRERGIWEVMVQLTENVITHIRKDAGLMKFVKWVA